MGGEKKIFDTMLGKTCHVDGFCEETKTVFEFYGCLYHACPLCFDGRNDHLFLSDKKMHDMYQETLRREKRLQELGYRVMTIWEHDYIRLKQTDTMRTFLDTLTLLLIFNLVMHSLGAESMGLSYFAMPKKGKQYSISITSRYTPSCRRSAPTLSVTPRLSVKIFKIFPTILDL